VFLFTGCASVDDPELWPAQAAKLHISRDDVAEIVGLVSKNHPGQYIVDFDLRDDGSIGVMLGDNPDSEDGTSRKVWKKNGRWSEDPKASSSWEILAPL